MQNAESNRSRRFPVTGVADKFVEKVRASILSDDHGFLGRAAVVVDRADTLGKFESRAALVRYTASADTG